MADDFIPDGPFDGYDVAGYESMDEDYDHTEEGRFCTHCGGVGYDECDDPIQCTYRHTRGGLCPCAACGGSGLAKDQRIW